jgi:hypothetical protein
VALALVLFVAAVAVIERAWRRYGMVPTAGDSMDLWDYERSQVHPIGRTPLFLVGGSRLLCDADLGVMWEQLPGYRINQLSVMGKTPIATVRDLAEDERVRDAVILVDVAEHALERSYWPDQEPWVRHYHESKNLSAGFEAHARALFESYLVVANPVTGVQNLLDGKWPKRDYVTYGPDRSCSSDYSLVDAAKARAARTTRVRQVYGQTKPPDPAAWLDQALAVEPFLHELTARNVRVAFFRPPTTGDHWLLDSQRYPRDRYWDRFRDSVSVPTIHFKDYPGLDQFDAPDGSHMDAHDLSLFTECLVDALVEKGLVTGARPSRCKLRKQAH